MRNRERRKLWVFKMWNYCGLNEHKSREQECKAFSQACNKYGEIGHFKKVCKSRNKTGDKKDQNVAENKDKEDIVAVLEEELFEIKESGMIGTISSGDLVYNKFKKLCVQRHMEEVGVDRLLVTVKIFVDSYKQSGTTLKVADGRRLTILGAFPVVITAGEKRCKCLTLFWN